MARTKQTARRPVPAPNRVIPPPVDTVVAQMTPVQSINEFEVFTATPRRREKPTVQLTNVLILSRASRPAPVDLFDALFKGPFSATGTYTYSADCKLKCNQPTPCPVNSSNIDKFAIEENADNPDTVKIYFEGGVAWYEIISVHPSYASIFIDMQLKARIWLWIQHKRSAALVNSQNRKTWPTLNQLYRSLPVYFKFRLHDPINTFHPYLIERIIQSQLSGETLAVGPEGIEPRWSECQAVVELERKYPAVWQSIFDRAEAATGQISRVSRPDFKEPLSPVSMRAKVQKPSRETRLLQGLFEAHAEEIKQSATLARAATIILDHLVRSHEWRVLDANQLIEKVENHAEVLLTMSAFTDQFTGWKGLDEIRRFCYDRKWWKKRRVAPVEPQSPPLKRGGPRRRLRITSDDTLEEHPQDDFDGADISQDELTAGISSPGYTHTAKKGTSVLRPQFSMSQTPGTPTRQGDPESDSTDLPFASERDVTDEDDIQLLQLPIDVSQRIQNETKPLVRKRKAEDTDDEVVKRLRKSRNGAPTKSISFKFGRGRPPLTTVTLPSTNEKEHTTLFRCSFPECSYTRVCSSSTPAKAEIDKHHRTHRSEIRDALEMLRDPFIIGGRVGGEKGNRLVRPIGAVDHLVERIEEMAKGLGSTPSKRLMV